MAKKEEPNKSQAIRDALKAHKGKSPAEIAEILKGKGIEVSGPYVSTIKSNMGKGKKGKKGRRKKHGTGVGTGIAADMAAVPAALEFIKAAGGLEAAKAALGTVEEIAGAVK